MVCVVGRMRDLILQLSKSSIYSTKPLYDPFPFWRSQFIWKCSMTVCTRLYFHHRITITKCKK
ncbi:hypothetical protein FPG81_19360 [Escherichia coli]|nr:hypothetical protein [Escherichia coli]EFB9245452.1 hypothetical protein [Escherichia coli]